jgi:CDP-glucose 4,6-dehydratase
MTLRHFDNLKSLSGPVLITGHTGFKGKWLTLLLDSLEIPYVGYSLAPATGSLYAICAENRKRNEKISDIREYDVLRKFFLDTKPSAVIHLAAQPLVIDSYLNPAYTFDVNVMGTINVMRAATEVSSVKSVICVTTDKVYRNNEEGKLFSENDPLGGKDPYSSSKVACESAIDAWRAISKLNNGPDILSVRSGNVIGGGDISNNRLLPDLINGYVNKKKVVIRNPKSTRPWQHVLDPLYGYLLALEVSLEGKRHRAFNFATKESSISVEQAIEVMKKTLGPEKVLVEYDTRNSQFPESSILDLDPELAFNLLGWEAAWSQEEAIKSTFAWWEKVKFKNISPNEACKQDIARLL